MKNKSREGLDGGETIRGGSFRELDRIRGRNWTGIAGWISWDLRGENLPAGTPPPLIGAPVCQNTGSFVVNSLTIFHKKQFSFVIPLFSPRIPRPAYDYLSVFPALHMSIRILAHVFRLLLTSILILTSTSHRSLVSSSSSIDAIARVRSILARHRERTFARHSVIHSLASRTHATSRTATRHADPLTYRPARSIRARAR